MDPVERRYDDQESARIIKRALEIQQTERPGEGTASGLSLTELEGIARESGIDPELVRRAAHELSAESGGRPGAAARLFVGGPIRSAATVSLRSSVSPEVLESLLVPLPTITGDAGTGSVVGRTLMWASDTLTAMRNGRSLSITVRPRAGGTEIRVEENLSGMAGGLFGGIVGGLGLGGGLGIGIGVGIAVLGSPLFAALVPIGVLAGAWQLARGIFALVRRYRKRREARILETIRSALESGPAPSG